MAEKERKSEFGDGSELASSDDARKIFNTIDLLAPLASTMLEYRKEHRLTPGDDLSEFAVKRGRYPNGFGFFDGASIYTRKPRLDLGPDVIEHEKWEIYKNGTEYIANKSRLVIVDGATREDMGQDLSFQFKFAMHKIFKEESDAMLKRLRKSSRMGE